MKEKGSIRLGPILLLLNLKMRVLHVNKELR